jgi:protocatechuate 3,4-dioxygenase beta subunit
MCDTDHYVGVSKGVAPTKPGMRMTRRQSIGAAGAAGVAYALSRGPLALFGGAPTEAAAASCVLSPAMTEGPYFVDELLERGDIRADSDGTNLQTGVPLSLTINVTNQDEDCSVGSGVIVDVWHCSAGGKYSDIASEGTTGHDYLRGYGVTDSNGQVQFTTVYPGWYSGRTIHLHYKVRAFDGTSTTYEFTSQFFFDQSINNAVATHTELGYTGVGTTTNSSDGIYGNQTAALVPLTGSVDAGYSGEVTVGLTGLPATSDDPGTGDGSTSSDEVEAKLISARVETDREGRRRLVAKLRADERVDVKLRLLRDGKALVRGSGRVRKGTHEVGLRIPKRVDAGGAKLKAILEDAGGNVATDSEPVRIPRGR